MFSLMQSPSKIKHREILKKGQESNYLQMPLIFPAD